MFFAGISNGTSKGERLMHKILHVTESLGGGVLHCIALLANEQARSGHRVTLIYSVRSDTPDEATLARQFDPSVRRIVMAMRSDIGMNDIKSLLAICWVLCGGKYDAIHCHSSKAGALVRIAAFMTLQTKKTCYSPHGFAFLRRDVSERKRKFFLLIEKSLHRLGGKIAACSATEKRYAEEYLKSHQAYLLENAIDFSELQQKRLGHNHGRVRVVTSGRVTYAKAPWRFAEVARRLVAQGNPVDFEWLGDGDVSSKAEWIGDSPVEFTGWLDKPRLMNELASADIFLFPSLWEGMPIALIEAQAMGIPAVATNIVGNKDIVVHGETGFLTNTDDELAFYSAKLASDSQLRARMGEAARQNALRRFGKERLLRTSLAIYFDA